MRRNRTQHPLIISVLLIVLLVLPLWGIRSSAHRTGAAASEEGPMISPAGALVLDATTRQPAVGSLPVDFVRSPDHLGPNGGGRYLVSVNSGFGIQFNAAGNRGQQSLSLIDLNAKPAPLVVQNVYFPSPQSVNVGVVFSNAPDQDGSHQMYVSGGFENKIWIFRFMPGSMTPITPAAAGNAASIDAPFIDVNGFTNTAPSPRYNDNHAPVYPTGLAISPDGNSLYVANNLGDSLGIVKDIRGSRALERISLAGKNPGLESHFTYPYAVVAIPHIPAGGRDFSQTTPLSPANPQSRASGQGDPAVSTAKVYISCWNDSSVAVINFAGKERVVKYVTVGQHPTAMLWDGTRSLLFVANSGEDSVSVIDTRDDRELERINVRLREDAPLGNTPEGLALSGNTLYVANAHSNSVALVRLSKRAQGVTSSRATDGKEERDDERDRSEVRGFIPTGSYPSAVSFVAQKLFIGNGKGTGVENSSVVVNGSGRSPNTPNDRFPAGTGRGNKQGGQYSVSLVTGNISVVPEPDDRQLAAYTQQVMRNNGLIGATKVRLFPGQSPIKHVIYVIKENRTYDQVFGDVKQSGDGTPADGDAQLAIFGAGDIAKSPTGAVQDITPNHRALALRFGLFDRFFVNSEASPDGHNWSTAAFSSDYVDKAYRWEYSDRGRGYDYEGFNRLPSYDPKRNTPSLFGPGVVAEDVANFLRGYIPYLHGSRDVSEPATLYLWDAAARAGLTYRNYGEFVATLSESDVAAIKRNRAKSYPDLSPTVSAIPTKKSLEGHHSAAFPNFDMTIPDAVTVESYGAARASAVAVNPLVTNAPGQKFPGTSRMGVWLDEFRAFVADRDAGKPDRLPNLSMVRLPNDHTDGLRAGRPTPQFYVADNDYALGLLVDVVSHSSYWKDTAIIVLEDDAQDGPDHVDAHRSVALVISAYNRPGLLIHKYHDTVSVIRTMEMLLGIAPMNQRDANAVPIDIFRAQPDLRPYSVNLPNVAPDNLLTAPPRDAQTAYWMKRTLEQDLTHQDMADPLTLNQIIWFSVRGNQPAPVISRLPAFEAMRLGLLSEELEEKRELAANRKPARNERDD
jgi:DNA-binding beta-propeller fold protein YncE